MVEHVEGFQAKVEGEALVDREDARNLRIELIGRDAAEGVAAGITEGSRHGVQSESGGVQIAAVGFAGGLVEGGVEIEGNSRDLVRAVAAVVGQGLILAFGYGEGGSALEPRILLPAGAFVAGAECTGTSVTLWTGDIRYKSLAELRA